MRSGGIAQDASVANEPFVGGSIYARQANDS